MLTDVQIRRLADEFTKANKEKIEAERDWLVDSVMDATERVFEGDTLTTQSYFDTLSMVANDEAEKVHDELTRESFDRVEGEAKAPEMANNLTN